MVQWVINTMVQGLDPWGGVMDTVEWGRGHGAVGRWRCLYRAWTPGAVRMMETVVPSSGWWDPRISEATRQCSPARSKLLSGQQGQNTGGP